MIHVIAYKGNKRGRVDWCAQGSALENRGKRKTKKKARQGKKRQTFTDNGEGKLDETTGGNPTNSHPAGREDGILKHRRLTSQLFSGQHLARKKRAIYARQKRSEASQKGEKGKRAQHPEEGARAPTDTQSDTKKKAKGLSKIRCVQSDKPSGCVERRGAT